MGKGRKTQHQKPEFGQTQGEIKKKPAKKYTSIIDVHYRPERSERHHRHLG
jgi:hypothetical protein